MVVLSDVRGVTLAVVAALGALGACGGDDASSDAPDAACWPLASHPGGTVVLGTGDIRFEPVAASITIVRNGSQSDPYVQIHAHVEGIPPGNPQDFFDPANPRTKVSMTIPELGLSLGVDCPATIGYVPAADGGPGFDMLHSLRVGLGTFPVDQVIGKMAVVTVEVVGSNQLYATDSKSVVLQLAP